MLPLLKYSDTFYFSFTLLYFHLYLRKKSHPVLVLYLSTELQYILQRYW